MRIARIKKRVIAALLGASLCTGVANAQVLLQENKLIRDIVVSEWGPMIVLVDYTTIGCTYGLISVPSGSQTAGNQHSTFMAMLIGAKLSQTRVNVWYTATGGGSCMMTQLALLP